VINADDPQTLALASSLRSRVVTFSIEAPDGEGIRIRDGRLVRIEGARETPLMETSEVPLPGRHNLENVAASAAIALALGAAPEAVGRTVAPFRALPHRLRFVRTIRGVSFYDDSKATNAGSARRAVESFPQPVVLLLGGRDKGGDFPDLARHLAGRLRAVVTFGEAGPAIASAIERQVAVVRGGDLDSATRAALEAACEGDVVLLAPACASFDAFPGYAARGDAFVKAVEAIAREAGVA
jgi:UDP-N-acetylmuramoylalanine--D-glutamate ligase